MKVLIIFISMVFCIMPGVAYGSDFSSRGLLQLNLQPYYNPLAAPLACFCPCGRAERKLRQEQESRESARRLQEWFNREQLRDDIRNDIRYELRRMDQIKHPFNIW